MRWVDKVAIGVWVVVWGGRQERSIVWGKIKVECVGRSMGWDKVGWKYWMGGRRGVWGGR